MSPQRKRASVTGRGLGAYFDDTGTTEQQHTDAQIYKHTDKQAKQQGNEDLERATFYIRPEQHSTLEALRIQLRQRQVKTNKSELLRAAIDLLAEQDIDVVINKLSSKAL